MGKQDGCMDEMSYGGNTPLGRLAVTDHCAHAVSEMTMLDRAWRELRGEKGDTWPMPVWDSLQKSMTEE